MLIENAKISVPRYEDWTEKELPNKILVGNEEFISVKKGLEILTWNTKQDKKRVKKEIRDYNNRRTDWRNYPISMSKPIYSRNKDYALIEFINGNNGGNVSLFHKKDGQNWKYLEDIYSWAY